MSNAAEHHPLLPSMSLDSFLNFVEEPGGNNGAAPAKAAMLRQARPWQHGPRRFLLHDAALMSCTACCLACIIRCRRVARQHV